MPYISLEEHLPGVTGLLEYSSETGSVLRELTQLLLRGPSTLNEAERELIATIVSHRNKCTYCVTSHTAAADAFLGEHETSEKVKQDIQSAPVSEKMKALLTIASQVQESGKSVKPETIEKAKQEGATELEIHDTVLIAALFCLYNRYVDGLATVAPVDSEYYRQMAERLKNSGYNRPPQGYDHLKK
ncbi:MAG: carboxymuconolactone decarboxylase family protein [Bacteroidia bacterium]